jgi:hypothetical protein
VTRIWICLGTLAAALATGLVSALLAFPIAHSFITGNQECDGVCLDGMGRSFVTALLVGLLMAAWIGYLTWRRITRRSPRAG